MHPAPCARVLSRAGRAAAALALVVAPGCYCSHERERDDASVAPDAARLDASAGVDASGPDAGPPVGAVWIPVDVPSFELAYERCETREGQTLVLRLRVTTDGCDEPGSTRWSVEPGAREIRLRPFVWRPTGLPPCPPFARVIERDVAIHGARLTQGTWTVIAPDGTALSILIGPPPPELTCTDCRADGESCAVDEECEGLRECVPLRGDAACASFCAASCQPFDESATTESDIGCTSRLGASSCAEDANLGWICSPHTAPCDACPEGMDCGAPACDWNVTAWPERCRADGDCPAGRSCVLLPGSGSPTCYVRCRGDHPCPYGERCGRNDVVCPHPKI